MSGSPPSSPGRLLLAGLLLLAMLGTPLCTAVWVLNRGVPPEERDPRAAYAPWGAGGCLALTLVLGIAFVSSGKSRAAEAMDIAEDREDDLARLEAALQERGPAVRRKLPRPHVGPTRPPGDNP